MAETKKYLHNIDVAKNKLTNFILNPATTAQRIATGLVLNTTHQGYVIYDTDDDAQYFWDGTQWITVSTTWGSITGDITTQYDLYTNFVPYTGALNHVELGGFSYKTTGTNYNTEQSQNGFFALNNLDNTGSVLDYYHITTFDLTYQISLFPNELRFYKNGIGSQSLFPNSTFTGQISTLPSTTGFLANSVNGVAALADGSITIPSGGTTLNGTGFVKASGTTITYDNSTYEPSITAGTTSQYWRGDKTWQTFPTIPAAQIQSDWNQTNNTLLDYIKNKPTIPTVGTWGTLNYPTWTTGTPFVKMTAAGTFGLDTNTYLTSITSSDVTTALGYTPVTNARTLTINGSTQDLTADRTWSVGTVTSVGLTMPSAFSVASSPVIGSGTLAVTGAGVVSQYIRGDGSLANFPISTGGGSSVSYYLNGSVNQGTFGGVTYYEINGTPISGAGTDFTINADGYIAQFITDVADPNKLLIPAGNWNFETYFSASSSGGSPSFYIQLYKYDGTTFTLIASNSATPENITGGTSIDLYFTALAVPSTTLLATDRLAVRFFVTHSGRTITMHTEDNHLSQIITTFSTGLTALNGLTAQVQSFATGTSGTDFGISSSTATHTFNLPTASATNRGALATTDWNTFNNKVSEADAIAYAVAL